MTDELLENNQAYAAIFDRGNAAMPSTARIAVVACMDARLDVYRLLGLKLGDAHVIRNAGGVVTDDVIRSLVISQRLLDTDEIVLIHHTGCGMLTFDEAELQEQIEQETGMAPDFDFGAFDDIEASVRESIRRIESSPFIPRKQDVRGFVCDIATGRLHEVGAGDPTD